MRTPTASAPSSLHPESRLRNFCQALALLFLSILPITTLEAESVSCSPDNNLAPNQSVTVSWVASNQYWIAFFADGAPNSQWVGNYIWTGGVSGSTTMTAPAAQGTYQLRMLSGYMLFASTPLMTVGGAGGGDGPNTPEYSGYQFLNNGTPADRDRFQAALTANEGGTLELKGNKTYQICLSGNYGLNIPPNTTIHGQGAGTVLRFTGYNTGYHSGLTANNHSTLDNLKITRGNTYDTVFVSIRGSNVTIRNVEVDGAHNLGGNYSHAFVPEWDGSHDVDYTTIDNCKVYNCDSGLFMADGRQEEIHFTTVKNSQFHDNYGDDVNFNADVAATWDSVTVSNCQFSANHSIGTLSGALGGFAVQLAKCRGTNRIEDCTFTGYASEPVHMERNTDGFTIIRCTFTNCSTNGYGVIHMVNNVNGGIISDCTFNMESNTIQDLHCVNISGESASLSHHITVTDCTFKLGARTSGVGAYSSPGNTITGCTFIGTGTRMGSNYNGGTNHGIDNSNTDGGGTVNGNTFKGLRRALQEGPYNYPSPANGTPSVHASVKNNKVENCRYEINELPNKPPYIDWVGNTFYESSGGETVPQRHFHWYGQQGACYENWLQQGDKWFYGDNNGVPDQWYYILPNGAIYLWGSGTPLATVSPSYHLYLQTLIDTQNP